MSTCCSENYNGRPCACNTLIGVDQAHVPIARKLSPKYPDTGAYHVSQCDRENCFCQNMPVMNRKERRAAAKGRR